MITLVQNADGSYPFTTDQIQMLHRMFTVNMMLKNIIINHCYFSFNEDKFDTVDIEGLEVVQKGTTLFVRPKGKVDVSSSETADPGGAGEGRR
jgi:hypothetical protein